MFVLWLLLLCSAYSHVVPSPDDDEGEYVLNFDSPIYVCPDDESQDWMDTSKLEVKRHNETSAYMTGSIHFLKGLQHSTMLELIIEKEASGRYEMMMSHEICDICNEMEDPNSLYHSYLQYFGFPDSCPFEAGEYPVHDLVSDTSEMPINRGNAGRYLVTLNLFDNPSGDCKNSKTFICCLKLDLIIEPV